MIQHGGDAIEAEAVEAKVLEPVGEVREEKGSSGGVAIVEEEGVPLSVFSCRSTVKEVAFLTIKFAKTFCEVFDGMRMDEVHHDCKS